MKYNLSVDSGKNINVSIVANLNNLDVESFKDKFGELENAIKLFSNSTSVSLAGEPSGENHDLTENNSIKSNFLKNISRQTLEDDFVHNLKGMLSVDGGDKSKWIEEAFTSGTYKELTENKILDDLQVADPGMFFESDTNHGSLLLSDLHPDEFNGDNYSVIEATSRFVTTTETRTHEGGERCTYTVKDAISDTNFKFTAILSRENHVALASLIKKINDFVSPECFWDMRLVRHKKDLRIELFYITHDTVGSPGDYKHTIHVENAAELVDCVERYATFLLRMVHSDALNVDPYRLTSPLPTSKRLSDFSLRTQHYGMPNYVIMAERDNSFSSETFEVYYDDESLESLYDPSGAVYARAHSYVVNYFFEIIENAKNHKDYVVFDGSGPGFTFRYNIDENTDKRFFEQLKLSLEEICPYFYMDYASRNNLSYYDKKYGATLKYPKLSGIEIRNFSNEVRIGLIVVPRRGQNAPIEFSYSREIGDHVAKHIKDIAEIVGTTIVIKDHADGEENE
jgi:hypothetical protein